MIILILTFALYVIVPLLISILFKKIKFLPKYWTFICTTLILFCIPVIEYQIKLKSTDSHQGLGCMNGIFFLFIFNLLFGIPIAFFLQKKFNAKFLESKK